MKLKDLKKLLETATDDTEITVENGEIVITEPKPIEYKFQVGDKVRDIINPELMYTVIEQFTEYGEPMYRLKGTWGETSSAEKWLELVPQDITERIKTFDDARRWCVLNNYGYLEREREEVGRFPDMSPDIVAYLQLRIITAALNEGWEPTEDDSRYTAYYDESNGKIHDTRIDGYYIDSALRLCFRCHYLAEYAANQFRDIYADFCGCKKGGEK